MVLKLFRSRKFAKITLLGLLILIIPAFVFWGIGSATKGQGSELIGTIGPQKIFTDDLLKSHQGTKTQLLFSYGNDYNTFSQIVKNRALLNYLAWERLILLSSANKQKFRVTNKDIISFVSQHPLFQRDGVFDRAVYQFILRNVLSLDARQFEELLRENLKIDLFRQNLLKDVSVSGEELKDYYKSTTDKAIVSYVLIDKEMFSDKVLVSNEEITLHYETNKETFFEPAKAEIDYIEIPFDSIEEKNAATNILGTLLPELRSAPKAFKEKAKEHNLKYGAPLPFSRNDIIPNVPVFKDFLDTAFALKQDEISSPVINSQEDKGTLYVLHKIQDLPREQKTFEVVKEEIIELIKDKKSLDAAQEKANTLFTEIDANNLSLQETAEKIGVEVQTTEPVTSSGYIENIGSADRIVFRAREIGENKMISPIPVNKGFIIAHVDEIIAEDESDFEEKKEDLRSQLLNKKQIEALRTWFDENKANVQLKKPLNEI